MKKLKNRLRVKPGSKLNLKDFDPADTDGFKGPDEAAASMNEDIGEMVNMQEKLFAGNTHSVLMILQAMDAAGKDGVIKHVMTGLNPQGCRVTSFRHPSDEDYKHDYFWRYNKALPECGQIGIFNRSYYEHALICRVHPELIMNEKLPDYDTVESLDKKFWAHRFRQINRFEKNLAENGTTVIKFFLHLSKGEQRKRLLGRIDDPDKHWKFNLGDITERKYWKEYHKCYAEVMEATSTSYAPWYIIPADNKWYARAAIASLMVSHLHDLKLKYPSLDKKTEQELLVAASKLQSE